MEMNQLDYIIESVLDDGKQTKISKESGSSHDVKDLYGLYQYS